VAEGGALGRPDVVILPGTKSTARDLEWLRRVGLADRILDLAADRPGPVVLGVCGGFQMLGRSIDDPQGIESDRGRVAGLGMLDVSTRFTPEKARFRVSGYGIDDRAPVTGYEIHMGVTERGPGARPWIELTRVHDGSAVYDGAHDGSGRVFGTYVHGLFDSLPFTVGWVNRLRAGKGLAPLDSAHWQSHRDVLAIRYARLAELLRTHVNLAPIWAALGRTVAPAAQAKEEAG
jgi:adenosylcobyric acid synthase